MMEYTKGPWEWVSIGDYVSLESGDKVVIYPNEQYNLIATQEDKNLIAAAPDMYEALKGIQSCKRIPKMLEHIIIMKHIEQALAKAEGK